jgi:hypothetical protein
MSGRCSWAPSPRTTPPQHLDGPRAERRLEPQLRQGYTTGLLNNTVLEHLRRLYRHLPDFIPPEPPALLHGFDPAFYQAYDQHHPLSPNYRLQWERFNGYPQFIHLNGFGVTFVGELRQSFVPRSSSFLPFATARVRPLPLLGRNLR